VAEPLCLSMSPKIKHAVFFVVGVVISAACLWLVLRKQNLGDLVATVQSIHWTWVVLSTFVFYFSMYLRAVRWRLFFPPGTVASGRRIFGPMMIGYTLNNLFPGRIGEVARAVIVGCREPTTIATAMATVVAERVFDIVTVLGGLALVLAVVPFGDFSYQYRGFSLDTTLLESAVQKAIPLIAVLIIGIITMMVPATRALVVRLTQAVGFLPHRTIEFAGRVIESFARGFEGMKSPARIVLIIALSIVIWALAGWSVALLGPAFETRITVMQGIAIMVIVCVAILIPAAPGYWGLYEAGFLFAATVLAISTDIATMTAMALLLHLCQYVPIIIIGFVWAAVSGTSVGATVQDTQIRG